ncbi:AzlC family ABC transporter permease [Amaricoccus sp.]|uniref:AzlC family ABC transporter permease n=1 Tax=Amaricoccus sp. TaxID=1872485 RepID=UPI002634D5CF|nr:AzlC family ABC transporter permease [Amaricoccus sp.]HRO11838.1 AzlC family ABC transporter permease [Amaricoccus sp.]
MPQASTRRAFWLGMRDALPFLLVIVPFGMLFGVLASEAGWRLTETLAMSAVVIAGASQFTALQLLSEQAPLLICIIAPLAINLRMAMYSASLAPHLAGVPRWQRALMAYGLTDQSYGVAMNRYALSPKMGHREKVAHYFGTLVPVCVPWWLATWAGAEAGTAIPEGLALDFAVPITFIALFAPMLRTRPHVAAAAVAVAVALLFSFLPWNLWLIVASLAGMATGSWLELRAERRS